MYKELACKKLIKAKPASLKLNKESKTIDLSGHWSWTAINENELIDSFKKINSEKSLTLDGKKIDYIDTSGIYFINKIINYAKDHNIEIKKIELGTDAENLFENFAKKINENGKFKRPKDPNMFSKIGYKVFEKWDNFLGLITFFGKFLFDSLVLLKSPRLLSFKELFSTINHAGIKGLTVTSLLNFLLGMTLAYEMSPQFKMYGANIFAVNFLGISLLKEVSPLITAIIIAGRTGSAIAAEIGTMKVQEELDAIQTMGISPGIRIVIPKVFGVMIAAPIITAIGDVASLMGGAIVVNYTLDLNYGFFLERLQNNVSIHNYTDGIYKSLAFGFLIALVGCFCGFKVKGNANSIGEYTTKSVVLSIFLIVCTDALFAIIFETLKI